MQVSVMPISAISRNSCCAILAVLLIVLCAHVAAADDLEKGFADPPIEARLRAYWWWLNGNVDRAAITKDLEWMKRIGMGGALIFDAGGPAGPTPTGPLFGSPEWRALLQHAVREADRLGLQLTLSPQSGWNLGGPSVTPDIAAKHIAWSELQVQGPAKLAKKLPVPKHRDNFYRDTFVLAYRVKEAALNRLPRPEASASSAQADRAAALAADGDSETFWVSQGAKAGEGPTAKRPEWVQVAFPQAVKCGGAHIVPRTGYGPKEGEWQTSSDGKNFETVKAFRAAKDGPLTFRTPETSARYYRLLVRDAFDPRWPAAPRNVQIAEIVLLDASGQPLASGRRGPPIRQLASKAMFHELGGSAPDCSPLLDDVAATPGEEDVAAKDVLDISAHLDRSGTLAWDVPAGTWQILRFGCTTNGGHVSTSSGKWQGPVVDYLDPEAMNSYWKQVVEPLLDAVGPLAGRDARGPGNR